MALLNIFRKRGKTKGPISESNPNNPYTQLAPHLREALASGAMRRSRETNDKELLHATDMAGVFPEQEQEINKNAVRNIQENHREAQTHGLVYLDAKLSDVDATYKAQLAKDPDYKGGIEVSGDALARAKRGSKQKLSSDIVDNK
jgi:hypothetical protein